MFEPNDFYNRRCLHQQAFTPKTFYTRGILQQRHFTPKGFFTPESFYRNFLHWGTFATKYVYAVHLLHQTSSVHQRVFTPKDFDTTKFYTRKLFWDVEPQTFHTNPFSQQTTLTTKMHFAPKTFYTNEPVHQRPSTPEAFSYTWFYAVLISPEHTYIWNFSQTVCTLYTKHFKTPENLYRGNLLQQRFNKVLHRTTLMLEALYTKDTAEGFYLDPFTSKNFCTRNLCIKTGILFLHMFFSQGTFVPKMFDSCATSTLHQRVFTAENFYTRSLCTKQFLHQKPLTCTRVLEQEPFTPTSLLTTCPQVNLRFWAVFSIRLTRGYHLISFDII